MTRRDADRPSRSPRLMELMGQRDYVLDVVCDQWHEGTVGQGMEFHEYLGITLEEYGYLLMPDYHDNSSCYIDLIDYLNRNGTRIEER